MDSGKIGEFLRASVGGAVAFDFSNCFDVFVGFVCSELSLINASSGPTIVIGTRRRFGAGAG